MPVTMDDEQKVSLPAWATLTQVSASLAIPRSAVRSAARRALKRAEAWVKKDAEVILLDTRLASTTTTLFIAALTPLNVLRVPDEAIPRSLQHKQAGGEG